MPLAHLNGHDMYYEIHGTGAPALCMTGWGTFCHGGERHLARGLTDRYSVIVFDYRGIGDSGDDPSIPGSMRLHADDAAALLDHLGVSDVHVVGLVGMGACVGQELAITRPDLVRTLVNMGAWAEVDDFLRDQLEMLRFLHREAGFDAFQRAVSLLSFDPDYYNENKHRLLGPAGGWSDLIGRFPAHSRLIDACVAHHSLDRLAQITAPALVIHAGRDQVTGPRLTMPIEKALPRATGVMMADAAHVIAGRELRKQFCDTLLAFLEAHS